MGDGVAESTPTSSVPARILIWLVTGYRRFISPLLGPRCRFYPSCSAYAVEALRVHGALRGVGLTIWRLLRCQPFHPGGYEPVPPRRERKNAGATIASAPKERSCI